MPSHPQSPHHHNQDPNLIVAQTEPPGTCNRCLVLAGIVLFVAVALSSVPNLLSATHPPPKTNLPFTTASPTLSSLLYQPPSIATTFSTPSPTVALNSLLPASPLATSSLAVSISVSSTSSPTPLPASEKASTHAKAQPIQSPKDDPGWKAMLVVIKGVVRVCIWAIWSTYRAGRFLLSRPWGVVATLTEGPYQMARDITKAFLPVYSFFAMAAIIGIVVGGSATWIAQLLISAIGAGPQPSVGDRSLSLQSGAGLPRKHMDGHPPQRQALAIPLAARQNFGNGSLPTKASAKASVPRRRSHWQAVEVQQAYDEEEEDGDDDDDDEDEDEEDDWQHT